MTRQEKERTQAELAIHLISRAAALLHKLRMDTPCDKTAQNAADIYFGLNDLLHGVHPGDVDTLCYRLFGSINNQIES